MPHIQIQVLLSMKNNCRNLCNTDTQQAVLALQLEMIQNVSKSYHKHNSMQVQCKYRNYVHSNVHTHKFNGPFSGTTHVSRYQKGKINLDFTEAKDSEWQWHQLGHMQVCT